jgi:histidinol phosphatase-like PHP family hydrolase
MRRAVLLNHGYNYYVMPNRPEWAPDEVASKIREAGNERIRAAMQAVRELNNPDLFCGIETDLSRDGQPLHDTRFTEEFDVILYGDHYLHWVAKMDSVKDRVRAWLDHVDAVLARPDLDVFAHPFRELRAISNNEVPTEAVEQVLRWADERRVGLELNSQDYVPEAATVRMLRFAADRGLPVVVGTDAHTESQGQRHAHGVGVDAMHALVQITELRGQARVALDHTEPIGGGVVEELQVEQAVAVADGAQKASRHVQRAVLHALRQAAGQLPAHEGAGAGVHHGVHHAQSVHLAVGHPAVQVVLRHLGRHRCFQQHAVRAAGLRQTGAAQAVEGLHQVTDDPQLAPAKARVRLQRGAVVRFRGQNDNSSPCGGPSAVVGTLAAAARRMRASGGGRDCRCCR